MGKNKSFRTIRGTDTTSFDTKDPWLSRISMEGDNDDLYMRLKEYVKSKPEKLEDNDVLKKYEGFLSEISLFLVEDTNKEVLIRGGSELIIPSGLTKELVSILHETHLSSASMKRQAREKFWWPSMSSELDEAYKSCKSCSENAI